MDKSQTLNIYSQQLLFSTDKLINTKLYLPNLKSSISKECRRDVYHILNAPKHIQDLKKDIYDRNQEKIHIRFKKYFSLLADE